MRLLAYSEAPELGGAEIALGHLLGALSSDVEVRILATAERVAEHLGRCRPGASHGVLRAPRGMADVRAAREHLRALRAWRPDVLHTNHAWPWACGYAETAALLVGGIRILAVDHLPVGGAIPRVRLHARRQLAALLDAHVAVGAKAARLIEQLVGLPRGSVGSIPNGVPPYVGAAAISHGDVPVVGAVGRLTSQKAYDDLVHAIAMLPAARLVLVGDGPARTGLEQLAERLGVSARLTITGWVDEPRALLGGFDVFALPSRWEGMPLSIIEAMHAGLPVVATDVGSVSELIVDGETGLVIAPGDREALAAAIERLLADEQQRRTMGQRAQEVALREHTARAMAQRYEKLYRQMLTPARRGSSTLAR